MRRGSQRLRYASAPEELVGTAVGLVLIQTGRLLIWVIPAGRWRSEAPFGKEGTLYRAAGAVWQHIAYVLNASPCKLIRIDKI